MRKFFFVCSVFMIIKKEPFRILLHVLIKHVPSKLHIQNRNHADTCRSTDFSTSGQALDRLQSAPYIAALPPLPYLPRRLQRVLLPKNGIFHLEGASRLDAFSVYPFQAWLLCHAVGTTTDTPAACPSRSSRTKDSSSQISYAHAG